jgi:hypothetical protein
MILNSDATRGLGKLGHRAVYAIPQLRTAITSVHWKYDGADATLRFDPGDRQALEILFDYMVHVTIDHDLLKILFTIPENEKAFLEKAYAGQNPEDSVEVADPSAIVVGEIDVQLDCIEALVVNGLQTDRAIKKLREGCRVGGSVGARSVDLLGKCGPAALEALPQILELLGDTDAYVIVGDVYGNGGEIHYACDHAMSVLASMGEKVIPPLIAFATDTKDHAIRARAASVLGMMNIHSELSIDKIIEWSVDPSHLVRRSAVDSLGQIAQAFPESIGGILPTLESSCDDKRYAVRIAAKSWIEKFK